MIEKIRALKAEAEALRVRGRQLNIACNELNGVAAVIPQSKSYPLNAFRGSKVILHNVSWDIQSGDIYAVIQIPYTNRHESAGHRITANITESWFPK